MPQRLVIHLCLSVEAAPLDLVLYTHQQVEAELEKIKKHPDYTKVLSLQQNLRAALQLECLKRQDLWEQKSLERSHISILNQTSLETWPMRFMG